jgi:hypothetical protein
VDFAFAPGNEPRLKMLQQLLRDRTDGGTLDTTFVTGRSTVTEFLSHVDTVATKPTGDLLLGSHGNDTGWLEIDLDSAAARTVSYAVLKEAFDDVVRRNRLRIPPSFYTTPQGGTVPIRVLIKGCRVGQAPKFVNGLKLLFGGQVPVVAPKHFYAVRPIIKTRKVRRRKIHTPLGQFEHLVYTNEIVSPTAMKRADLLAAFRGKGFQQFDSTPQSPKPIPDLWDVWLPKKQKELRVGERPIRYTVSLGRTIEKFTTLSGMAKFRHKTPKITIRIANPPAAVKTLAGFKAALAARPDYKAGWGPTSFPVQEQYGHANFDDFFNSFTWTPSKKKSADPFIWVGQRHEYNVMLPVVQSLTGAATDRLLYNFFPPRGSGGTTFIELLDTNAGLFFKSP